MEDVECPLLPFVSRSSPSTLMYISLSVAYIRRYGLSLLLTRPNTTVSVAYVSEAAPIPQASTHILLYHTIPDHGSPHTFNKLCAQSKFQSTPSIEYRLPIFTLSICLYLQLHEQAHVTNYFTPIPDAYHHHQKRSDHDVNLQGITATSP